MSIFPFKKRGQKPRTAGQRPRAPGEQPRTQGQQRQAAPGSPARAGLVSFGGLGEEDIHAIYRLAPIKLLAQGEALVPPSAESSSPTYIVTGGGGAELYAVTRPEPEHDGHGLSMTWPRPPFISTSRTAMTVAIAP